MAFLIGKLGILVFFLHFFCLKSGLNHPFILMWSRDTSSAMKNIPQKGWFLVPQVVWRSIRIHLLENEWMVHLNITRVLKRSIGTSEPNLLNLSFFVFSREKDSCRVFFTVKGNSNNFFRSFTV